jgi:hypothetical protein
MQGEYIQLPSKGLFYTGLYKGLTQLLVRPLSWEDEDILTTEAFYKNGTLFQEILNNCIIDENGFKAKDLVNVDKDAILWWLRIKAFGPEYKVPIRCSNCNKTHDVIWDLSSFNMPEMPLQYLEELEANGCIEITLPASQLKCKITSPSIGREIEIYKKLNVKKDKLKQKQDFNITGRLLSVIKEITDNEGNVCRNTEDIVRVLRTGYNGGAIPMIDSRYIQQKAREINLSIDTSLETICPHCDHVEVLKMPITIYFFFPDYMDGERSS